MKSLSISQSYFEFIFYLRILLWVHSVFDEFTMNSLFILRPPYEYTWCFANSLWFHYLYREFSLYFADSLWIQLVFRKHTCCTLNSLSIHSIFRAYTLNSLSLARIHYELGISLFAMNLLVVSSFTMNSLFIADPVKIHLVFREFTMN